MKICRVKPGLVSCALMLAVWALGAGCQSSRTAVAHTSAAFRQKMAKAEQGDGEAQYQLARAYQHGRGVLRDLTEAVRWYQQAATNGHVLAQAELGLCYRRGQGVDYDAAESVRWLRKAAEQGDAEAQAYLGLALLEGRGVPGSFDEAEQWFRKSAEQGNDNGEGFLLGFTVFQQVVAGKDASEAWADLEAAAEDGNAAAQAAMGVMYFEGQGVTQDYEQAVKWLRRAARKNASAQGFLGLAYFEGHGVAQSFRQAVRWSRAGAERGNDLAQRTLGLCYQTGKGVEANPAEAVKWFHKSAEQGDDEAQVALGSAYAHGQGVACDLAQAYRWLDQAAVRGNPEAVAARADLASQMNPEQLAQAGAVPPRHLTKFDRKIVDDHRQRYGLSCIPSAVEIVLKLLGRVPGSYYELQDAWQNKADGSFHDFDGRTIAGVTFHSSFWEPHGRDFPLSKLFDTIARELRAGRFVIVGLACPGGVHDWVIYDADADGDFLAVSKAAGRTIEDNHVRRTITEMQGTDIGTYEIIGVGASDSPEL